MNLRAGFFVILSILQCPLVISCADRRDEGDVLRNDATHSRRVNAPKIRK